MRGPCHSLRSRLLPSRDGGGRSTLRGRRRCRHSGLTATLGTSPIYEPAHNPIERKRAPGTVVPGARLLRSRRAASACAIRARPAQTIHKVKHGRSTDCGVGTRSGIRTRDLHLERVTSWATRLCGPKQAPSCPSQSEGYTRGEGTVKKSPYVAILQTSVTEYAADRANSRLLLVRTLQRTWSRCYNAQYSTRHASFVRSLMTGTCAAVVTFLSQASFWSGSFQRCPPFRICSEGTGSLSSWSVVYRLL